MSSRSLKDSVRQVLADLRQTQEAGRLAHAYLVSGSPRGAGGDLALRMAQLVFCPAPDRPCGHCESCLRVAERRHPDVLWVEPQSKARQIRADEIRRMNGRISVTSYEGGWKVGVILDADRMNSAAANTFLKTLEEPPPRSLLVLVSEETHALIPTLVSRCQRVNVSGEVGVPEAAWMPRLRGLLAEGYPGSVVEALGRAGDYAAIVEDLIAEIETREQEESPGADEEEDVVVAARVSARAREAERELFRAMLLWQRDVLVARTDPGASRLHYAEDAEAIRAQARALTPRAALRNIEFVEHALRQRDRNFRLRTVLEQLLIGLGRSAKEQGR